MQMDVEIVQKEGTVLFGKSMPSSDSAQGADIPALSKKYYAAAGQKPGTVLPFYVASEEYDEKTGSFRLFVGAEKMYENLEAKALPEGMYAKITVRPKLGFLWGPAIGQAKGYFFGQWLPASPYAPGDVTYEYHDEKSVGKKPTVDLLFYITPK